MHERHGAERLAERDEVLGAERVRIEGLVDRRVEVHDAGDVHDHLDDAFQRLDVDPAVREPHVPVDGNDLLAQEGLEAVAVLLLERLHRLARGDFLPEALLARERLALADEEVNLPDLGEAVEQHDPVDLAEEAGASEEEQPLAAELGLQVERGDRARGEDLVVRDDDIVRGVVRTVTVGSVLRHGGSASLPHSNTGGNRGVLTLMA